MKTGLLAFIFYLTLIQTDVYYVTFVKGIVQLESTKKIIKPGDKITAKDKLIFKDQASKVSCISPSKGRFEIRPDTEAATKKGEWLAVIGEKLIPSSTYQRLSTRSLDVDNGYDPINYFGNKLEKPIVILSGIPLPVKMSYKIDAFNFFFLQYDHEGKTIVRKVGSIGQSLLFIPELFTDSDGNMLTQESLKKVFLCYQSNINSIARSKSLVEFRPLLVDRDQLASEISFMYNYLKPLKNNSLKDIHEEIFAHLIENYGKIDANLIEKEFLVQLK
ncbi:hypothetical protein SAMN05421813_10221 [Daejeonella rubra]|uniref:Uncharacterized protein n=1 Tax=Daejeonella rubra TaxID=990371 RepID=A0A1G9ML11_9SPHI|nr:hypothetical protein [Daejeonella rubra]SDL74948.1 hypothetical protein SAMN05421813_10221 [Daejeonella rubra]